MKIFLAVFLLLTANAYATDAQKAASEPSAPTKTDDNKPLDSLLTRENLADCIAALDRLIDEGEHGTIDDKPHPGMVETATKMGLNFEFSATIIQKEAIIYYLTISRGGLELKYSDAAKFAALFADRAALPHPIDLKEGDKAIFYAQWLIKPSEWKSMKKLMLKYRAINRAEKDPFKAFSIGIEREMDARAEALRNR
jgi:hypothetical protein